MSSMRTTVTLDPDVAYQLKALARRRNLSFKAALNSVLRAGLAVERGGGQPYQTPARPMGLRPGVDLTHALRLAEARDLGDLKPGLSLDNVAELIEQAEGPICR